MTKEEIDSIHIEQRCDGRCWNIMMFVVPKKGSSPCHPELVKLAEEVIRKAKGLGKEWFPANAETMVWSSRKDRGVLEPHRVRVTLDMVTKDWEAPRDEDW